MVTRCTSWPYVAAVLLLTGVSTATAKYSGGTGEPNDPYQIATAADLIALGETPDDYDKHFVLTADIDLDPNLPGRKVFDRAVIAPHVGGMTNWFQGTTFTGVFDGSGHVISRLTINGGHYIGLFGQLRAGAQVRNLGLVDVHIQGGRWCVGALAGLNGGTVTGCHSTGDCVGGLLGYNSEGVVSNCHSTGTISGGSFVGGLLGYNSKGIVSNCYSTGLVSGSTNVGGLAGRNGGGCIVTSYNSGPVTGASQVGGLVGDNGYFGYADGTSTDGNVAGCWSTGTIAGKRSVGGLVGHNVGNVVDCYAKGSVCGDSPVGGLVGVNWGGGLYHRDKPGYVARSYSVGCVDGQTGVGGLVGDNYLGSVISSFWNVETSGQTASYGGTGKTTAEMHMAKTFLDAGWDFLGETANGTEDIWKIAEGLAYPRLAWEKYSGGTGEPNDPYQIATAADLIALGETPEDYDKHFILTADIDLDPNLPGRKVFDRAVIAPDTNDVGSWFEGTAFAGVFDGDGHVISRLTINGGHYVNLGLFGQLAPGGEVKGLGVVDVNITGGIRGAGALCASNLGSIRTSYSTGSVSGSSNGLRSSFGGLVAGNFGTIAQCYSHASVSSDLSVGGLVGINLGNLVDSYSTGLVRGPGSGGGLVGTDTPFVPVLNMGPPVGTASGCFWDIETSGRTTSDGGEGKTTAEMQTASTFLDAGWDFVGETVNGPNDVWKIAEGLDYPRLWWEPYDGRVTVVLGQVFTVTLESNPSTGYRWEWVDHQDSIVEQMGEAQFKPRATGDPPLVGAGGWESFDFQAVHPGQMTLKLVYRRPWEEGVEPLKSFSLQVTVP